MQPVVRTTREARMRNAIWLTFGLAALVACGGSGAGAIDALDVVDVSGESGLDVAGDVAPLPDVVEIEDCFVADLQRRIAEKHGYIDVTHKLEFFGICPDCRMADADGVSVFRPKSRSCGC